MRLLFTACLLLTLAQTTWGQNSLGVVRHNHLALQVKDLEVSRAFYRDILGLEPIAVPDNLKAIRAWFRIGTDQQIHLLAGRAEPVVNDRNGSHFAVFVASIEQAEAFLKARNLSYHAQTRFDGVRQIYVPDPDGYLIELNEATAAK
jgi:catechol 2,3-dioxygenase-like lactoylglutathione lyase family enzyme